MYYIISFHLDLKLNFYDNNIIILNTIFNQYVILFNFYIFNIDQLVQHVSNYIINIIMIKIVVQCVT